MLRRYPCPKQSREELASESRGLHCTLYAPFITLARLWIQSPRLIASHISNPLSPLHFSRVARPSRQPGTPILIARHSNRCERPEFVERNLTILCESSCGKKSNWRHRPWCPESGFSLIEVMMAIGIVAFAIIPVMGLLPTGLSINRQAIEATVSSQIVSRISQELAQSDFSSLPASSTGLLTYLFDNQGNLVGSGTGTSSFKFTSTIASSPNQSGAFPEFDVLVTINKSSSLPSTGSVTTQSLATARIDVLRDPAGSAMVSNGAFTNPSNPEAPNPNVSTFHALISKND